MNTVTTIPEGLRQQIATSNHAAAMTWSHGGEAYDAISRQIADAIEHAVDRLEPRPGQDILDVATGTGWAARRIDKRGASVTGIDFGPEVVTAARRLDKTGRITFDVGDAECLPYDDATFDGIVSTFGVMFCANPERAAAELSRVCKPGGRIVLTTWTPQGIVPDMFRLIQSYKHPQGSETAACPFAWGDSHRLVELLGDQCNLGFEQASSYFRARDGAEVWQAFSQGFGPVTTLHQTLDPARLASLRTEFEALHERCRTGAGLLVERTYMVTVGDKLPS